MPTPSPTRRLGTLPLIALTILAVIALLVVAYVLIQWWNAYHIYGLTTADVRDKLDSYKVQVDDLQRLVSLLIAFSSLYALVLGVSSYLSAQGLIKQSEDNAKQIEKLREDLEKSFPFFRDMGRRMISMKERLENLMPDSDERDDYYERLSILDKRELEAAEQSAISWLYYLDFSGSAEIASGIYRNLGKYYGARHKREKQDLAAEIDAASQLPQNDPARNIDVSQRNRQIQTLADRASFFFSSAIQKDPNDFLSFNDFGYLTQDIEGDQSPTAENYYRASIRLQPRQQRAYYDLAIIEFGKGLIREAEELSTRALGAPNWQIRPNPERANDVQYNRACYRSHLGALFPKEQKKWADNAEEDLQQVCQKKDTARLALFIEDCKAGKDLAWFASRRPQVVIDLQRKLKG
jgi:preprotein translocase subunit SecG